MSKREEDLIAHLDNAVKKLKEHNQKLQCILDSVACDAPGCPVMERIERLKQEVGV